MANKFSVAMCTYAGSRFLEDQLASIAAQTRPPDELIVCDDRSPDETVQILQRFAATAPFPVQVKVNVTNIGTVKNFEGAIALCSGDLIALCDQDDVWLPEKLERIEDEFICNPALGLVFSDAELVDENARSIGQGLWDEVGINRAERELLAAGNGLKDLIKGATVTGATMAFRSKYKKLILPIPKDLSLIHDAWISLLTASVAEVKPIEERLVLYRQHSSQQVGPRQRRQSPGGFSTVAAGLAREAAARTNPYEIALAIARAANSRLIENSEEFDSRKSRAELEALIAHFEMRARLSSSSVHRIIPVLKELFNRRYSRFSNGVASAAKDLWRGSSGRAS